MKTAADSIGILGVFRRLKSKAPLKKLIAELYPDVNTSDALEMQCFILAIDAVRQTLDDFEHGPSAEYYQRSLEWCNENEADLPFDRVCGQLRMNERQARTAIAAMFPSLQVSGPLSILKPKSIEIPRQIGFAPIVLASKKPDLGQAWFTPMARMNVFSTGASA